jgi:hypothetical protein
MTCSARILSAVHEQTKRTYPHFCFRNRTTPLFHKQTTADMQGSLGTEAGNAVGVSCKRTLPLRWMFDVETNVIESGIGRVFPSPTDVLARPGINPHFLLVQNVRSGSRLHVARHAMRRAASGLLTSPIVRARH